MDEPRIQFRLSHIFIAVTAVGEALTGAALCRSLCDTDGIKGVFYALVLIPLVALATVCLLIPRLRLPSAAIIVAVFVAIGVRQLSVAERMQKLNIEVKNVVAFVDSFRKEHGAFPSDLSAYKYRSPELRDYISYSPEGSASAGGYHIWFNPTGGREFGHYYSPKTGYGFVDD